MARMSRCSNCQKCNPIKVVCEIYKKGIPKDILNESKVCEHYAEEKTVKNSDDNVLIAKGR